MQERDRIKQVRLALHLTTRELGAAIGIQSSAVSKIETGKTAVTDRTRSQICHVYHVNEEWLRTGEGEMFATPPEKALVDDLKEKYHLTEAGAQIVEQIALMPPAMQEAMRDAVSFIVKGVAAKHGIALDLPGTARLPASREQFLAEMEREYERGEKEMERSSTSQEAEEPAV